MMSKILRFFLIVAIVAQVAAAVAYTDADAQAYVREVTPLVEQSAGRKFTKIPPVKVMPNSFRLPLVSSREIGSQLQVLIPELTNAEFRRAEIEGGKAFAVPVLGDYDVKSKTVMLFPVDLPERMVPADVDVKLYPEITRLVVAHELTHALQDQVQGIGSRVGEVKGPQSGFVSRAMIEGQATLVMGEVARALGNDHAMSEFLRAMGSGWRRSDDPAVELVLDPMRRLFAYAYIDGREFLEAQEKRGGKDAVWQVVHNPPARSSMIFSPNSFPSKASQPTDFAKQLRPLQSRFGAETWMWRTVAIDYAMLRAVYEPLSPDKRRVVPDSVRDEGCMIASKKGKRSSIAIYTLKQDADPAKVAAAMSELDARNLEAVSRSRTAKITDLKVTTFPYKDAKFTRKLTFKSTSTGEATNVTVVRVGKGNVVIEICTQGLNMTDAEMKAIVDDLLK